jgi:hypothetical protein
MPRLRRAFGGRAAMAVTRSYGGNTGARRRDQVVMVGYRIQRCVSASLGAAVTAQTWVFVPQQDETAML